LLPGNRYLTNNVFEATRGCIHNCDFCVVPTAWGRKPYLKPVADVVADIRQHGARKLIFTDQQIPVISVNPIGYNLQYGTAATGLSLTGGSTTGKY